MYVPVVQLEHVSALPKLAVPAVQAVHAELPVDGATVPAAQVKHEDSCTPAYVPAKHVAHADRLVDPVEGLAVPAGHDVHAEELEEGPYVPTGHVVQLAAPAPEKLPALHTTQADDELDKPYLAGFEWDKEESWTQLVVHLQAQPTSTTLGGPAGGGKKKKNKKQDE